MARVTLQTIADQVGVSRMTVSNAFSRPDQLSDDLRRRILDAAEELGYVGPDPAARALARGASGTIGVLLTDRLQYAFTDEVATTFLGAVADELAPTGLAITLLTSSSLKSSLIPARDIAMDGAIIFSCEPASPAVDWLVRRRLPLVTVDKETLPGVPSVNIDDRGGARAAAQHLHDLGHRRIGLIVSSLDGEEGLTTDPAAGYVAGERLLGWRDVLEPAETLGTVLQVAEIPKDASSEANVRLAGRLLDLPERPTAVLAYSDLLAQAVWRAALDRGLRVPEDLSVVGFDDAPTSAIPPGLTTVHQDSDTKGRTAVRLLRAAMEASRNGGGANGAEPERVLLPTELVVRGSTAPPRV